MKGFNVNKKQPLGLVYTLCMLGEGDIKLSYTTSIYMNNVAEVDLLRSTCLHRAESTAAAPLVDSACASRSGGVQESTGEHSGVNLSHLG